MGGLTAWSRHGIETMLGPARLGFVARFERLVDPAGALPTDERRRRAERARRAHMLHLAERSAEVRRAQKGATPAATSAGRAQEAVGGDDDLREPA
jgi:hypothetical protein